MSKNKDVEKKLEKELEKALKPEKELKIELKEKRELKEFKEIEKFKPEKEFPDKLYKEIEKIKPEKEYLEKFQKDLEKVKPEKEFEKGIVEGQQDPTRIFKGTGSAEDRLAQLEDAVTKLCHFIGVDLRPDLTMGALKAEDDVSGPKPHDKKK